MEARLTGKAIEKIKGLGYSEAGYKAAKVRLVRKYEGNRWEIQCHVEELLKMKFLGEQHAKELETIADML